MRGLLLGCLAIGCDASAQAQAIECVRDDDCVLLPRVTCCGECAPSPPYEAAPRWVLDGMLVEAETTCARSSRPCTPPVCDLPTTCVPHAACTEGRCQVSTRGCPLAAR
jgi:hypothetical protein